jgi:DNA repair protein RecO (recombination protein O)
MLYRVEGIVIRSMDYGEGNKIITILTKSYGKMSVMARGAKKVKSRQSAITQLFTYGEFIFYKTGSMGTLNHGEIIEAYHELREDIHKTAYCSYLMELTDRMLGDQDRCEFVFDQLKAALDAMKEDKDPQILIHIYEMKMLGIAGYMPDLQQCVSCGSSDGDMMLSAMLGGILCRRCWNRDPQAIALPETGLKLLRLFQQVDIRRLGKVELKPATKQMLKRCMRQLYDTHVDVKWKSRSFLDQMEKYGI